MDKNWNKIEERKRTKCKRVENRTMVRGEGMKTKGEMKGKKIHKIPDTSIVSHSPVRLFGT